MVPETLALLEDVRTAAARIQVFVSGRTFQQYLGDDLLRSGVERQFMTIGEALARLRHFDAATAARITDVQRIIAFRNVLVHRYTDIDDKLVWTAAVEKVTLLSAEVHNLLAEGDQSTSAAP